MGELTVVQKREIAKGAQAMGAIVGRYAKRKSDQVTSPLATLSFWGRVLSVAAVIAALACAGLMVIDASGFTVERSRAAVVARGTVNVRQAPSTGSAVLSKSHMGDRYTIIGSDGNWLKVQSPDRSVSGWISGPLLDTSTNKSLVVRYDMKGYFSAFLISLCIVFFALRMKRMSPKAPGKDPTEDLLVKEE